MLLLNISFLSTFSVSKSYIPNSCLVCMTHLRNIIDLNLLFWDDKNLSIPLKLGIFNAPGIQVLISLS